MSFGIGDRVRHPKKPEWGDGLVEDITQDGKVQIHFSKVGRKKLTRDGLTLELVSNRPPNGRKLDFDKIFRLCDRLHSEMSANRKTTDDGNIGVAIKHDLVHYGELRPATRKQFLPWCQTGGSFVRGEPIAREICTLIYGRVLPRE